ncbi:MAG: integrase, partial [Gammaproteobacteria bacterium]
LRHAYAQQRYRDLTGWAAPLAGGPPCSALAPAEFERDRLARVIISGELGHARARVTHIYLGR